MFWIMLFAVFCFGETPCANAQGVFPLAMAFSILIMGQDFLQNGLAGRKYYSIIFMEVYIMGWLIVVGLLFLPIAVIFELVKNYR